MCARPSHPCRPSPARAPQTEAIESVVATGSGLHDACDKAVGTAYNMMLTMGESFTTVVGACRSKPLADS